MAEGGTGGVKAWLPQVLRLLLFSRPSLAVAVSAAVASFLAVGVLLGAALTTLSPPQEATRILGDADALVAASSQAGPPPGSEPPISTWGGALDGQQVTRHDVITVSLSLLRSDTRVNDWAEYYESVWPSPPFSQRYVLLSGRMPSQAGECLRASGIAEGAELPFGQKITMVGVVQPVFQPEQLVLLCAKGTWAGWHPPTEYLPLTSFRAVVSTYLSGPDVETAADRIRAWPELEDGEGGVMTRNGIVALYSRVAPQRFLDTWAPLLGLPFGMGVLLGGSFGAWAAGVARRLHVLGLPKRRLLIAAAGSATMTAGIGSLLGLLVAFPASAAIRPLLVTIHSGPLGDSPVPVHLLFAVVGATLFGALAGVGAGMLAAGRRHSVAARQVTTLNRRDRLYLGATAMTLAGIAAVIVRLSNGQLGPMVGGALLGSVAAACAAALALWWLGGLLQRSTSPMRAVAGRLLRDDSRRWGLNAVAFTAFVGVLVTTFIYATSSAAALLPFMASRVPPGVAALAVIDPTGRRVPDSVVADFEREVGVSSPVRVREDHYLRGPVWSFASLQDLERVLGPVPAKLADRIQAGAVLSPKVVRESRMALENFSGAPPLPVDVIPYTEGSARRHTYAAGFGLVSALPPPAPVPTTERLVYLGLDPAADRLAGLWPLQHGFTGVEVLSYKGEAEISVPMWTAVSLSGFSLLVLAVVVLAARREVVALKPLLGAFVALGLPKSWLRAVVFPVVLAFSGVCAVFALVGGLYGLALLAISYSPTVFDAAGVPWWLVGSFLGCIPLAATCAGLLLTRGRVAPTLTQAE